MSRIHHLPVLCVAVVPDVLDAISVLPVVMYAVPVETAVEPSDELGVLPVIPR